MQYTEQNDTKLKTEKSFITKHFIQLSMLQIKVYIIKTVSKVWNLVKHYTPLRSSDSAGAVIATSVLPLVANFGSSSGVYPGNKRQSQRQSDGALPGGV